MKRALLIGISEYQVFKEDPSVSPLVPDSDRVAPPFPSPSENAPITIASTLHPSSATSTPPSMGDQRHELQMAVQAVNPPVHDSAGAAEHTNGSYTPPPLSQWPRLDGPVNDVDNFESLLRDLGFCEMTILKNEHATRRAILFELEKIVTSTTNNDVAVVLFCGHGTYIEKDEKHNKQSDALVPYDSFLKSPERDIRDDEIKAIMDRAVSTNITIILDSCYSSDAVRGPGAAKVRYIDRRSLSRGSDVRGSYRGWRPVASNQQTLGVDYGMAADQLRYVQLAACRDKEHAYETLLDGKTHGIFPYALHKVLRSYMKENNREATASANVNPEAVAEAQRLDAIRLSQLNWLEIFPQVVTLVDEIRKSSAIGKQTPQLIGLRSWRVFGREAKKVLRFFPAVAENCERLDEETVSMYVQLEAGYLHGVDWGSRWDLELIRPPKVGARSTENSYKFAITDQSINVISASTTQMQFVVMVKPGDADVNELLFKQLQTPLKALQVFSDSSNRAMIGSRSDNSENTIKNEDSTSIEVYVDSAKNILNYGNLSDKYEIEQTPEVLRLKSIQGNRILFTTSTKNQLQFVKDVDAFVRCTYVLDLPWLAGPDDPVWNASRDTVVEDIMIKIHLKYQPPAAGDLSAPIGQCETRTYDLVTVSYTKDSPLIVRAGEKFMIEARNLCNSSGRPDRDVPVDILHLTLLEFDSDCAINVLHPIPGAHAQALRPMGQGIRIGSLNGPGISIPRGAIKDANGDCMETLRFVVSTFPIDFQFITQTGINVPKHAEWEFVLERGFPVEMANSKQLTEFFKLIDVFVKIKPS